MKGDTAQRVLRLVLDPLGPLFSEPERVLLEETPTATEVRPLLDVIGSGAHRLSEIGGRLGRPATALARPLERLIAMGLVRREVPFGEPDRGGKRSLYKIADPFFRLWFKTVAPHRAELIVGTPKRRARVLTSHFDGLTSEAWEELCRDCIPRASGRMEDLGPWEIARRWWAGSAPQWDVVCESDAGQILVGEARWSPRPYDRKSLEKVVRELRGRPLPKPAARLSPDLVLRAVFVPQTTQRVSELEGVHVFTLEDLF